ncbi:FAD-dependent oxidoreductase [Desulfotomaculum nigrificans]|uniref:FAD-dependent oxidoreductase n=1 Tax=Desulfotomaculum nigrificans TaxID=1565 RepID=UPI0001FAE696|nr:FAD-dependent oxidoreductase [Desulfotomaculum nigrificans]
MSKLLPYLIVFLLFLAYTPTGSDTTMQQDIVVMGDDFAACAAARSAAAAAPDKRVLLVVPSPVYRLGGLGTVGGQNFTDIRLWQKQLVTQGSFGRWYAKAGQFYNTDRMAQIIEDDLAQFPNLKILYGYDIAEVGLEQNKITELKLRSLRRETNGTVVWGPGRQKVKGQVFIDASVDGRLTRLAGNPVSVGRADWPVDFLPAGEQSGAARQQAATLMFQVKGVKTPAKAMRIQDWEFVRDAKGSWGVAGGKQAFAADPLVAAFNDKFAARGLAIKPINAATNGRDSDVWWVNCLLVFNVDGRAYIRDKGSSGYPPDMLAGQLTVDEAWLKARRFLQTPDFIKVLHRFQVQDPATGQWYGFGQADLVYDDNGQPVVGQTMYIRETVHSPLSGKLTPGTENSNFAVTTGEAQQAGPNPGGADARNYRNRVGLGYYMMDINAFTPEDLKASGRYDWPVTKHLRPDWQQAGGQPKNPVYLPLDVLIPAKSDNLLVPGYAAGISSFAWAELRVLPNLAVLGDAAGVTAARSLAVKRNPRQFARADIAWVQEKLKQFGARLDK